MMKFAHLFEEGSVPSEDKTFQNVLTIATEIEHCGVSSNLHYLHIGYSVKQIGEQYSRKVGNSYASKHLTNKTINYIKVGIPDAFVMHQHFIQLWTILHLSKLEIKGTESISLPLGEVFNIDDYVALQVLNDYNYPLMMEFPDDNRMQRVFTDFAAMFTD